MNTLNPSVLLILPWQKIKYILFFLILFCNCKKDDKIVVTPWNQFHGDPSSSGQKFAATKPAKDNDVTILTFGDTIQYASPVLAPDGSLWVSSYNKTPNPFKSSLLKFSTDKPFRLNKRIQLGGQLSTPAVDKAGNVYVTQYLSYHEWSHLLSFDSNGNLRWDRLIGREGRALAPPKILEVNGGSIIFQAYSGGIPTGWHLLMVNDQNSWFLDHITCSYPQVGFGEPGFKIQGIDLGPPYPEEPAIGIRALEGDGGLQHYVVIAAPKCGISFYRLDLGANSSTPPALTYIHDHSTEAVFYTPSISSDGIVVIADSDKQVTAYDLTTGQERWHYEVKDFVSATPTMLTTGVMYVFIATYAQLIKLDLQTGQEVLVKGLLGPMDASPAAGGSYIFASTESGLFTYDLNLNLQAFVPFAGNRSSPALGSSGEVFAAGTDGSIRAFPGQ